MNQSIRFSFWGGSLLACFFVFSCSSGSDSGSSSGASPVSCETACNKEAELNCPNSDPKDVCINDCEDSINNGGESCKSKFQSILGCILNKGTLVCGPDGTSDVQENVSTICRAEVQAAALCSACVPQSSDNACLTCIKQSCCTELKDGIDEPAYLDWVDCRSPCAATDTACKNACDTKYASIKSKVDAVTACGKNKCQSVCVTG